ncbi:MAG: hypothetical protein AAGU21_09790 [Solidesulfovibrio sp.]|uniref:hypothetical protein n=1 Tax=Solidesulfovibrio sp. TaxID=2910990 RepID=UPI002B1F12FA|nr:hypothetical protein [Solidesulfovibrio sp.]MEA4858422.1 hypothetical protein [Solidesulfovibrio sp.]
MTTPRELFPRWQKRLLLAAALGLGLTGLGQMPIFSRYYVADIPGLWWLGDFRITAAAHLALAAVLLCVLSAMATAYLGAGRGRPGLTGPGKWRVGLYAAIAATGLLRVLQNGAAPPLGPGGVRYLDWGHLALAMGLLAFALGWGRKAATQPAVRAANGTSARESA